MKTLEGIRVVDFSWVIAGPVCTRYLALMGAEVIKVESRRRPDPSRLGKGFQWLNQNKRGLSLNISHPEGKALALELVSHADVVVENFATGVIERMGLGYEALRQVRPGIIMLSSSGLGHTGPERDYAAYGTLLQAYTGWSALQGFPGKKPIIGGAWTDPVAGTWQAYLIASALYRRKQTGQGAYLDVSMTEMTINCLPGALMEYAMNGKVRQPQGNRDDRYAPHNAYRCAGDDQWVAIAVTTDQEWRALNQALGLKLGHDRRFATALARWRNQEELDPLIEEKTRDYQVDELFVRLQEAGVPCGPSLDLVQVIENEHLNQRGFVLPYQDVQGHQVRMPGVPWQMGPDAQPVSEPAPELGQHEEYVLREILKLTPARIAQLQEAGALY